MKTRLLAFYLPQYYPFPENDEWWGKGFTEWTNVTKARPLFVGHNQPHLPADFGFYDLRVRATRRDQIRVAKAHGIDGFCYHYYWFSGKRLLDQPVDDMLADPESDMPFCLCWANENWTRRWDAAEHEILMAQNYENEDKEALVKSLIPYLSDQRYIKLDGKPFLVVYRPQQIPNTKETVAAWRSHFRKLGIGEVHLCAALTHGSYEYKSLGFDSGLEFPPHNLQCPPVNERLRFFERFDGTVVEYSQIAASYLERDYGDGLVFKTVFPDWDNTARTGNRALIVLGSSPEAYEAWLGATIHAANSAPGLDEKFVFINAWNEWAEGCHLEPDRRFGRQYLEATLRAKNAPSNTRDMTQYGIDWAFYRPANLYWKEFQTLNVRHFRFVKANVARRLKKHRLLRRFAQGMRRILK